LETERKMENALEKTTQNLAETLLAIMDKLAGKESDLKLSFEDLTLDMGMFKARLNGAVVLDIVYAKEATT
jgi:molecular chaperone GrpE (heat shock protein)